MSEKVVVGLIGTGGISQSQHLPNLVRAPHVHLKTICDLRADVLGKMRDKYRVPNATTSHRELLADPEIRAVVIATRQDMHPVLAVEALEAGKHVYVEKPLAETPEECARVVAAQRRAGKLVAVGFNRRMAPAYQKAKEILRTHGGPRNMHYRISDAYWSWGRNLAPGTRMIHEVCHIFDILRFFAESEVTSVYCVCSRPDDEVIALKFASGCVASIMDSGYVKYDMPKESLEVVTDLGGFTVTDFAEMRTFGLDDFEPRYCFPGHTHPDRDTTHRYLFEALGAEAMLATRRVFYEKNRRLEALRQTNADSPERRELEDYIANHAPLINYMMNKGWIQAVDHFAQCILEGRTPVLANAEDGLRASVLSHAAIRSRETGQVVTVAAGASPDP